jgi:hypothetical protein
MAGAKPLNHPRAAPEISAALPAQFNESFEAESFQSLAISLKERRL